MTAIPTIPAKLIDGYQRSFNYLRLSVTEACNFRCNYCLPEGYCPEKKEHPLNLVEISNLVETFARLGTRKIRITGGEPTLRKDIAEIIACCKSTPGIETVAMTSNGYRLTKILPQLVDAGLDKLNLSADSLQPETFKLITGHDKLAEVLRSVDMALELGVSAVKLNAVLLKKHNQFELDQYLEFVRDRPVSLRLIELMRTGDNTKFYQEQHLSGQGIQQQLLQSGWTLAQKPIDAGPALEYQHPDYAGKLGLIMPYSNNFCADCNRLRVSSEGNFHLCLFNEANADLRPNLQPGMAGELEQQLLSVVATKWSGHQLHQGNSGTTQHLAMLGG